MVGQTLLIHFQEVCNYCFVSQCVRTAGAAAWSIETGRHQQTTSVTESCMLQRSKPPPSHLSHSHKSLPAFIWLFINMIFDRNYQAFVEKCFSWCLNLQPLVFRELQLKIRFFKEEQSHQTDRHHWNPESKCSLKVTYNRCFFCFCCLWSFFIGRGKENQFSLKLVKQSTFSRPTAQMQLRNKKMEQILKKLSQHIYDYVL